MSTFHGGPADGVSLMFRRGPLFLRVVVDRSEEDELGHPSFDVLDQLEDEPQDGEEVHVYRRIGENRPAHLLYRGKKKHMSGFYEFADYEYLEGVEGELLRDTAAWREWANGAAEYHARAAS